MRILVNAATAVAGGAAQVAATFVQNAVTNPCGHEFHFAVSDVVAQNVLSLLESRPARLSVITPTPARTLKGSRARRRLRSIEAEFQPDIIYSIAAPSYVRFRQNEVARFTNPWVTHPNQWARSVLSVGGRLHAHVLALHKLLWLARVTYFVTQTETAAQGLVRRLRCSADNVRVIPNCHNQLFRRSSRTRVRRDAPRILVLALPYPHKNLMMVPDVAVLLVKWGMTPRFIMTMPPQYSETPKILAKARRLGVVQCIQNVGQLSLSECAQWYQECDVFFLPTLLETFSASYLEAMASGTPIVTTDLDFARDVCGDAACYFPPLSVEGAAETVRNLLADEESYRRHVERGLETVVQFPSSEEQYLMQMRWLEEVVNRSDGRSVAACCPNSPGALARRPR